jgi:hypothetical protein
MTYNVISTGSKGNALIIENILLIDCGVSFAKLKDYYKNLKVVLLTHIHGDHFNKTTIKKLGQERPQLRFACCAWLVNELVQCGVNKRNIDVLSIGKTYNYNLFKVVPILLYHNVDQCGYRVFINDKKLIYATDTNSLDGITAPEYDYYFIEANYTEDGIKERIKAKELLGLYCYEKDAMLNHLSKEKCDQFLYENMGANSQYVYMHKHIEKEEICT